MKHRLLLIEDSPTQLLTITRVLESQGYVVLPAKNGAEGLARAYYEYPDIIVSDVVMSGINGYQLCRLIKNEPDLAQTPVILLTKLDGSIDRFWGLKSGADRYIPKEPGFHSLISAVREILAEKTERPRLKVLGDLQHTPSPEEINSRLHQLLERLLFEATLADEVRKIGTDIFDLETIAQKLFQLLSSILSYQACALMVNHGDHSTLICDVSQTADETAIKSYVAKLGSQLGLPALTTDIPKTNNHNSYDSALTQPIDSAGVRLGLLVVIPYTNQGYKPGDQKVVRLVCEQLSTIIRLYVSYFKRNIEPISTQK
jgi:DNA-binding response OmpR family regulator